MNVQPRTIAVIDDDLRVLESLFNLLASFGYEARSYTSAEQFLGSGTLCRTSCIVTNVEMRQMSGLALMQYVKNSSCARDYHYGTTGRKVGVLLSGKWRGGLFPEAGGQRCAPGVDRLGLHLVGVRNGLQGVDILLMLKSVRL